MNMNKKHLSILLSAICILGCILAICAGAGRGDYVIIASESSYGTIKVRDRANAGDKVKIKVQSSGDYD
jgi:hypothetical protein